MNASVLFHEHAGPWRLETEMRAAERLSESAKSGSSEGPFLAAWKMTQWPLRYEQADLMMIWRSERGDCSLMASAAVAVLLLAWPELDAVDWVVHCNLLGQSSN